MTQMIEEDSQWIPASQCEETADKNDVDMSSDDEKPKEKAKEEEPKEKAKEKSEEEAEKDEYSFIEKTIWAIDKSVGCLVEVLKCHEMRSCAATKSRGTDTLRMTQAFICAESADINDNVVKGLKQLIETKGVEGGSYSELFAVKDISNNPLEIH
jgi:hypothetical protein